MRNIETGIQNSKSFNIFHFCETCNYDNSNLLENEINQQLIIKTIRVNRLLRSWTGRHNKDTTQLISNRSIKSS